MTITSKNEGDKLILSPDGLLDTTNAPVFEADTMKAVDSTKNLELDFSKVEYISSSGLRVLLKAQKKMNSQEGKMVITNVNSAVKEVFELTGFSEILTIQ